jgi:hypothetical protein
VAYKEIVLDRMRLAKAEVTIILAKIDYEKILRLRLQEEDQITYFEVSLEDINNVRLED